MTNLYLTVVVEDNLEESKEVIRYYITKDESYGFKITITSAANLVEKEILMMKNLTLEEEDIKELVKLVEKSGSEFTGVQDIVKDYLQQKNEIKKN